MYPESPTTVQKTDSVLMLLPLEQPYSRPWPSYVLYDPFDPLIWSVSLAASPDVVELQREHVDIGQKLQSEWAMADQGTTLRNAVQELLRLKDLLYASFEAEPLEDGIDHPAEDIIGDAIRSTNEARVLDWLSGACLDSEHPTFSASILRCLGRQAHLGTESWRTELVLKALTIDDAEIRDAALQAAEFWGGLNMLDILKIKVKTEPLQWLRNYMQDVIEDLK